ncbi:MAG: response regulator [Elusimicrobia bacterium]|nr:response regulator [Elusimicrobiota bacterium]
MSKEAFVLVVDDDPIVLNLVATRLEMAGYRVTTATDAWQQVVQAQGVKIGLIISDIMMPGVGTGVDAFKQLRATPAVSPMLPVVFMTGLSLDKARQMIPFDPHVRLISKPIDFDNLRVAIRELTGVDRPL